MKPPTFKASIDVRCIQLQERHPLIFSAFDELEPGEALLVVNGHDPRTLYYQFQWERGGISNWQYLEKGPEIWRVQISRLG